MIEAPRGLGSLVEMGERSAFLDAGAPSGSSSSTAPPAPGSRPRTSPPTTSAARPSRAATSSSASPGPTSSPPCTPPSSRSASTSSRPTPSAPSRVPLGEYGIAERAHEITLADARIAREVADGYSTPDQPALRRRLDRPGHQVRHRSARSASPSCATLRGARPRACSRAASTCSSSRPSSTCSASRPPMIGVPPGHGRRRPRGARSRSRSPSSSPAACCLGTEIGAALAALDAAAARHHRHQLRHRPGRDERAPPPPLASTPACPISCLPNAGLPSVVDGKMHYDLTPDQLAEHHAPLRHRARRQRHRRLLRHHARAHQGRGRRAAATSRRRPARPSTRPAPRRSTRSVPFEQDTRRS